MDRKKIIILIFALLFLVGILIFSAFFGKKEKVILKPAITPLPSFIVSPTIPAITEIGKIMLDGVVINDFYKKAIEIRSDGEAVLAMNDNYEIDYVPGETEFLISITNSPFEKLKQSAEKELISILGAREEDICKLKIFTITFQFANPDFAGQSYPVTACQ